MVQQFIKKHNLSRDDLQGILNSIESLKETTMTVDQPIKNDLDELIDLLGLDKVFGAIGSVLQAIPDIPDDIRMKSIAKGIAKSLLRGFKKDGLVKFLDQLNVANNGDTIDMEPLYRGLPVEFGDIEEPDEKTPLEET